MASKEQRQTGAAGGRCPICKAPTVTAFRPFCSARCRDVDLSRWLSGTYAIPGAEPGGEAGATNRDAPADGDEKAED